MIKSVPEYLAAVPDNRKATVETLHRLILEMSPDVSVDMQYKMPTYHYGNGWIALANQKNYVSLYTCDARHLVEFKEKNPHISTGKGCINFSASGVLPEKDIQAVIRSAFDFSGS